MVLFLHYRGIKKDTPKYRGYFRTFHDILHTTDEIRNTTYETLTKLRAKRPYQTCQNLGRYVLQLRFGDFGKRDLIDYGNRRASG